MTYTQTLDWMFSQLPIYQQKGASAFNAKLNNIKLLASILENPEKQFKSIHVAGTNGKGSSSHMLASILQEAGYEVGLYTSPHLKDFRERIRINGKKISKKSVVSFIDKNKLFFEKNKLSFFEMTVGMAFDYFAKQEVDIAIVEVGLGGRLDSTNIIVPEVSLITNIGLDHTNLLGNSLEEVAREKAGIIKQNVPVVISEYQTETASVFREIASEKATKIIFAENKVDKKYKTDLLGNYQQKNMKGVISALAELKGFEVEEIHITKGLLNVVENTKLMGRWQQLNSNPIIIADTAHNKEGLTIVMEQLKQQEYDSLHIVLGFVKDKNLDLVLGLFPKGATYYFCCPKIERGLSEVELKKNAANFELKGKVYPSVKEAFKAAKKKSKKNDLIFVGGSTFVVAEIL